MPRPKKLPNQIRVSLGAAVLPEIDAEQPAASALSQIYGIQFAPRISGLTEALYPRDFERNQGRIYPKSYPTVYDLVAVTEKAFVSALVANNSVTTILKKSAGVTDTGDFPGKVTLIRIISRSLENRDGADVLSGDSPLSSEPAPRTTTPETKPAPSIKPTPTPTPKICYEGGRKVPCP